MERSAGMMYRYETWNTSVMDLFLLEYVPQPRQCSSELSHDRKKAAKPFLGEIACREIYGKPYRPILQPGQYLRHIFQRIVGMYFPQPYAHMRDFKQSKKCERTWQRS